MQNTHTYVSISIFTGSHIPGLPWYLETLGATNGKESAGYTSLLRLLRGRRRWPSHVWSANLPFRLAGALLLLWRRWSHLVCILDVAKFRATLKTSKYKQGGVRLH